MTHEEQQAFIEAYDCNVGMYSKKQVERIVKGFYNGENTALSEGVTHILDFLTMWNASIVYQMKKEQAQ